MEFTFGQKYDKGRSGLRGSALGRLAGDIPDHRLNLCGRLPDVGCPRSGQGTRDLAFARRAALVRAFLTGRAWRRPICYRSFSPFSTAGPRLTTAARKKSSCPCWTCCKACRSFPSCRWCLLGLSAILPDGLAAKWHRSCLIFTSQAWNLTFSWYQSLTTIPKELQGGRRHLSPQPLDEVQIHRAAVWPDQPDLEHDDELGRGLVLPDGG